MAQHGAHIEIVERHRGKPLEPGDVIVPNTVRINGQQLWTSADDPIVVERVEILPNGREAVKVTLTLVAHRVEVKDESTDG